MTAKEKLLERVQSLSEAEAAKARIVLEDGDGVPEMAPLPEAWKTFDDGTPVPNWVAGLDEVRRGG